MSENTPLRMNDLLPFGLNGDQALMLGAGIGILAAGFYFLKPFIVRDRFGARLKMIHERRAELKGAMIGPRRRKRTYQKTGTLNTIRQVVDKLKLLQQVQVGQLQHKLVNAGFRSKDAIIIFAFGKLVMPFIALAVGLVLGNVDWNNAFSVDQAGNWFIVLGTAYFGARLPEIIVARTRARRHHKLRRALPDALDLMMICAEAGLSLPAALDRVARELSRVSPELAEEFSLTSVEIGFLPDRGTALKHLYERAELPEIRGFVNVIAQTEKYGTPIAQALRVLSKEYRTQRMLRAEQKAARLPAMMTVPMILFILPPLFIIIMAPAVISIMDSFL